MANNPTDNQAISTRPRLGVSQCLLGDRVRYDAACKTSLIVVEQLAAIFTLVPVCPEVEAGLGVPRPPVQLSGDLITPRMTGRDQPTLDVTAQILEYTRRKLASLTHLDGYVFKSRSPSCGLDSTPVFIDGRCVTDTGRGVFAREFCKQFPELPVIEDSALESAQQLRAFIECVQQRHAERGPHHG